MTEILISATAASVGRKKVNFEQTPLRLPEGTLAKLDALLADGEARSDALRDAVDREIKRRERAAPSRAIQTVARRLPDDGG